MPHREENSSREIKILAIDDEETIAKIYQGLIPGMGHRLVVARTGAQAMQRVSEEIFDLVILDLKLPDIDGHRLLAQIRDKIGTAPVIIVTAHPSIESSIAAIRAGGVYDYIIKPFGSDNLNLVVRRAIEKALLTGENKRLLKRLEVANQALTERVEQLESVASMAAGYESRIAALTERIKQLERK